MAIGELISALQPARTTPVLLTRRPDRMPELGYAEAQLADDGVGFGTRPADRIADDLDYPDYPELLNRWPNCRASIVWSCTPTGPRRLPGVERGHVDQESDRRRTEPSRFLNSAMNSSPTAALSITPSVRPKPPVAIR